MAYQHILPHIEKQEHWLNADMALLKNNIAKLPTSETNDLFEPALITEAIASSKLPGKHVLIVLINNIVNEAYSDFSFLPSGITIANAAAAQPVSPSINAIRFPFAANMKQPQHLIITVATNTVCQVPIHILSIANNSSLLESYQTIEVNESSKIVLMQDFISLGDENYINNNVTQVNLKENATIECYRLQRENANTTHLGHLFVSQDAHSQSTIVNMALGAQFSRDESQVMLTGASACTEIIGFYQSNQQLKYIDHHIEVKHLASHTESDMFFKGTASDTSKAVFNGRVYVAENVEKIQAEQSNHVMLLSQQAQLFSKPELEIYAQDVKCKHGATAGMLDEEALFYLCARGISKIEAQEMLLKAFSKKIFERIKDENIKLYFEGKTSCL